MSIQFDIDMTVLPPVALLQEIARQRYESAVAAECAADIAGFNKVSGALALGNLPFFDGHDWFQQSRQGGGNIYRLRRVGGCWRCDCEAGRTGRECWHVRLMTVVDAGWEQAAERAELGPEETEETEAEPQGPEEDTNYGGWRMPLAQRIAAARAKAIAEMQELYG
jgi:hypothetical protein